MDRFVVCFSGRRDGRGGSAVVGGGVAGSMPASLSTRLDGQVLHVPSRTSRLKRDGLDADAPCQHDGADDVESNQPHPSSAARRTRSFPFVLVRPGG